MCHLKNPTGLIHRIGMYERHDWPNPSHTLIIQWSFKLGCHKRLLSHCFVRKRCVLGGVWR
jgi:hypothetical protein